MPNRKNSNHKSQRSNGIRKKSRRRKRPSGLARRPSESPAGGGVENNRHENA
jgi:hypothetical protein